MYIKTTYKCDRCEKEIYTTTELYIKEPKKQGVKKDLCPECDRKLAVFLRNE